MKTYSAQHPADSPAFGWITSTWRWFVGFQIRLYFFQSSKQRQILIYLASTGDKFVLSLCWIEEVSCFKTQTWPVLPTLFLCHLPGPSGWCLITHNRIWFGQDHRGNQHHCNSVIDTDGINHKLLGWLYYWKKIDDFLIFKQWCLCLRRISLIKVLFWLLTCLVLLNFEAYL